MTAVLVALLSSLLGAPAPRCECDYDAARVAARHKVAWAKIFEGERLDDVDLQALADAQDIVECVANRAPREL